MFLSGAFSIDFFEHFNGKHVLRWIRGAQSSGNSNEILIFHVFFVFSILRKLNEHGENHEIQKSIWRYYSNENRDFHESNEAWE